MLPPRLAPVLTGLLLSGVMSFIVSGTATLRSLGLHEGFMGSWIAAWLPSYAVAFPAVLVAAPMARRIVARMVRQPDPRP
jgi:hypothetical protein